MSAAKKRRYHDPSLDELLRDMPDDSCAVRDYGAMQNEIDRLEAMVREREDWLRDVAFDIDSLSRRINRDLDQ